MSFFYCASAHKSIGLRNIHILKRKKYIFKTLRNMLYKFTVHMFEIQFPTKRNKKILISQAKLKGHWKFLCLFTIALVYHIWRRKFGVIHSS